MFVQLRGSVGMPSSLALFLRAEAEKRGWDDSKLARKAGIHKSTLHYILNNDTAGPRLKTLDGLAQALEIPMTRLIVVAGYNPGDDDRSVDDEQTSILMDAMPELREVVDDLKVLPPDDLRAIRIYIKSRRDKAQGV